MARLLCPTCEYNLDGATGPSLRCPECGNTCSRHDAARAAEPMMTPVERRGWKMLGLATLALIPSAVLAGLADLPWALLPAAVYALLASAVILYGNTKRNVVLTSVVTPFLWSLWVSGCVTGFAVAALIFGAIAAAVL